MNKNAVGALHDLGQHIRGQLLVRENAGDYGRGFQLPKAVQRQAGHLRLPHPLRVELRAEGHDQQHRKRSDSIDRPAERFQARRIDPMRIFNDHQHWSLVRQSHELRHQSFQRCLPSLLRRQF
jgi:hypothetical protein